MKTPAKDIECDQYCLCIGGVYEESLRRSSGIGAESGLRFETPLKLFSTGSQANAVVCPFEIGKGVRLQEPLASLRLSLQEQKWIGSNLDPIYLWYGSNLDLL